MQKKNLIAIQINKNNNSYTRHQFEVRPDTITYTGRLLGVIDDNILKYIINNKELMRKTITKESISLKSVHTISEFKNRRLLLSVKKKNNIHKEKTLFVTERIDFISLFTYTPEKIFPNTTASMQLCIKGDKNTSYRVTEYYDL